MGKKLAQKMTYFGINMQPQTLKKLDEMRGPIPRVWVIENAVIYYLQQIEKGNVTILQNFSSVGSPESSAEMDSLSDVKDNSPQHRPAKEDAVPVNS